MSALETLSCARTSEADVGFGLLDDISKNGISFAPCLRLNLPGSGPTDVELDWLVRAIENSAFVRNVSRLNLPLERLGLSIRASSEQCCKVEVRAENFQQEAYNFVRTLWYASRDSQKQLTILVSLEPKNFLNSGYELVFLRRSFSGSDQVFAVSEAPGGAEGLAYRETDLPEGAAQIVELVDCSFVAIFASTEIGEPELVSICCGARELEENFQRYLSSKNRFALANSRYPRVSPLVVGNMPLARVASLGDNRFTGPSYFSIDTAKSSDRKGVLFLETLGPSEVAVFSYIGGIVLTNDGPSSHIVLLAKSFGLAVLSQVKDATVGSRISFAGAEEPLEEGEIVTVDELSGSLFKGAISDVSESRDNHAIVVPECVGLAVATAAESIGKFHGVNSIALCRSEMQLYDKSCFDEVGNYIRSVVYGQETELPVVLENRLRHSLVELIEASNSIPIHYRLLDASPGDFLIAGELDESTRDWRGPRWALKSGFYERQLDIVAGALEALGDKAPSEFLVSAPSLVSIPENIAIFEIVMAFRDRLRCTTEVCFAAFLENPRLCFAAGELARIADTLCFGLNDLTHHTFGISRQSWGSVLPGLIANQFIRTDPLEEVDEDAVLPMVRDAILTARRVNPNLPIILCGRPAMSPQSIALARELRNVRIAIEAENIARVSFNVVRHDCLDTSSAIVVPLEQNERNTSRKTRICRNARADSDRKLARRTALDWIISHDYVDTDNWKLAKKRVVDYFFGKLEGEYFLPHWDANLLVAYIERVNRSGRVPRVSEFSDDISCHSRSFELAGASSKRIRQIVGQLDGDAVIHIFPQQDSDQLCFRFVSCGQEWLIEAGFGQAMFVFENERGLHEVETCSGHFGDSRSIYSADAGEIVDALKELVESHFDGLAQPISWLGSEFGLETFAVEGYFTPKSQRRPVIVDVDFPLDVAWN